MKKLAQLFFKQKSKVVINGKSYTGNNVTVNNDQVFIDGQLVSSSQPAITIEVTGDVEKLETTSGNVTVNGDAGEVKTVSGGVRCGHVMGNATSTSGNIRCHYVNGNIHTVSGDVDKSFF